MLITEPNVHVVAQSTMFSLEPWASDLGLIPVMYDGEGETPLSKIESTLSGLNLVEFAGRHCYRSWEKGRGTEEYIKNIIEQKHGSVLEHMSVTFAISGVSRSLSHELVRHRVGVAISQESQRYVNAKDTNFVVPPLYLWLAQDNLSHPRIIQWERSCDDSLREYIALAGLDAQTADTTLERKRIIEAARSVLPNAAETRLTWTANIRTLRHFFEVRASEAADLEIRRLAIAVWESLDVDLMPFFFDFSRNKGSFGVDVLTNHK